MRKILIEIFARMVDIDGLYYRVILWCAFVFWMSETAFFGFNLTAESQIEKMLDGLAFVFMGYGAIGSLISSFSVKNNYHANNLSINSADNAYIRTDNVSLDGYQTENKKGS